MGPDFLKAAFQLFPGKHTMYEVKFMRHAEVAPGCDGIVAQREDPGLLHIFRSSLRLAESSPTAPGLRGTSLYVKTAGAPVSFTMRRGQCAGGGRGGFFFPPIVCSSSSSTLSLVNEAAGGGAGV